jgi:hypothetical protein
VDWIGLDWIELEWIGVDGLKWMGADTRMGSTCAFNMSKQYLRPALWHLFSAMDALVLQEAQREGTGRAAPRTWHYARMQTAVQTQARDYLAACQHF